jgi:Zinc finger, C2H2 type
VGLCSSSHSWGTMHPQMSNQYFQNEFGIYTTPHIQSHSPSTQSGQAIPYASCDANYQDPYGYGPTKLVSQFGYVPLQLPVTAQQAQQFHHNPHGTQMHDYNMPMYPQSIYQPIDLKRLHPTGSLPSDDSQGTPSGSVMGRRPGVKGPKFDRTYTDALEDELFDESSSTSHSVNSRNSQRSRHVTPNFGPSHINQYPQLNWVYNGQVSEEQNQQSHQIDPNKQVPTEIMYSQSNPNYDPVHQKRSSTAQLAERVRHLGVPHRTTVSPREAFLDYPDNADFRERTLFSKSGSPYSQGSGDRGSQYQETEGARSNDEGYEESNAIEAPPFPSYHQPFHELRSRPAPEPVGSRSASTSTPRSAVGSGEASNESSNSSSDSEYDPSTARRASRSSGRRDSLRPYPCPDCGKRFDKSQSLQTHRRTSHGRASGPPSLSSQRFGNNAHRCDHVDLVTGSTCDTVFSRP